MGRRPQEDDRKKDDRLKAHPAGRRGPADHRRKGAGGAPDDDILRRRALQPHRVDHGVEEDGEGQKPGRDIIGRQRHQEDRAERHDAGEGVGLAGGHLTGGHRAAARALHHRVDIGVIGHVERAGCTRPDGDAQDRDRGGEDVHIPGRGHEAGEPGEDHQRHHARLHQVEIRLRPGFGAGLRIDRGVGHGALTHLYSFLAFTRV